ncbi:MFS transporter [bacterium]|nr:MFS transporter [bacterium]
MKNLPVKWIICTIIILGNFLGMLDSTTVQLALYPISQGLNISLSQVQWIIIAYMLVMTVFLPFFGKIGDLYPKNKVYACGFFMFALGAIFCTISPNFTILINSRCIEALGASIMLANGPAVIATLFHGKNRGKALGINGSLVAIGGMLGPAIGGMMINFFGWRTIFLPSVPIALICGYYAYRMIPSYVRRKELKFDYKGFLYFGISLLSLLLAISQGHSWGWKSVQILMLGILTLLFGGLFYFRDKKISYPMINFKMFKIKPFTFGNIAVMTSYMTMFTNAILLPLFLQGILKYDAFTTGLLILPYSVASAAVAPFAGAYSGVHGSKILTRIGPSVYILALLIFTTFGLETKMWQIVGASVIMGIGNGLFQSPSNNAIITSVKTNELGVASGILSLSRNLGNILGVAITITLFESFREIFAHNGKQTAFLQSYHTTMCVGILFGIICLACATIAYHKSHSKNI